MIFLENILEKLDIYLDAKQENEKNIMIYGAGLLIAFLAYYILLPIAEDRYNFTTTEKEKTQKILDEQENYMSSITVNGDKDFKVKQLSSEVAQKKQTILDLENKTNLINSSMRKLEDMIFDKKSWSTFLDSITETAYNHNISILKLDNNFTESNQTTFGHVLEIKIKCQGEYKDILKFMNDIEQNRLVTDIYGSKLKVNKKRSAILADLNISVWGINNK
ncbi:MAG: type 4a pilus biogenesis protein PilO [Sulfurovaceae bacterium]|nr:type 4a pilus biogenesis protein PilO [Sulfurovaceae bacterium]MDD5548252.1 type 4a pilus biogenesis protein PilO [Sulfurovaceae bacterium]